MKNLYKIQDELYIIDNNEKVTQSGIWAKCSFTGDILKNRNGQYAHKVILTTNKLLIKNGVQPIDDEFLEWFVKNPSCEEVEVEKDKFFESVNYHFYKIVIPKKELEPNIVIVGSGLPKQKRMYSEEEVLDVLRNFYRTFDVMKNPPETSTIPLWFEHYKK